MKAERKVFGRLQNVYDPPDLIVPLFITAVRGPSLC